MQPIRVAPLEASPSPAAAGPFESAGSEVPALEARGVGKSLGGRRVLVGVDLAIRAGECLVLRGDNGAGKTTLLRCLTGRLRPSAGEVLWLGRSPRHAPELQRNLGFVSHEAGVYPELTIAENLLFAARMYGLESPAERVCEMIDRCGLGPRRDQLAGRLSKGWRQRVGLARAFIHEPAIVLLDEPFASLDVSTCQWLSYWLSECKRRGCAILFSSHDQRVEPSLVDRECFLQGGRLIGQATSPTVRLARSA